MSTDDRKPTTDASHQRTQLPVEDLDAQGVEPEAADKVKGGIQITKQVDKASPAFFKN